MSQLAREALNTLPAPDGTALGALRHVVATYADSPAEDYVLRATDPQGARVRSGMLAHGWPEHLVWQPDPGRLAELEQLTEARREALRYPWTAVTDPAPPEVAATYEVLRVALVAAGLPAKLAEIAADLSSLEHLGGIVAVVRWTAAPKP